MGDRSNDDDPTWVVPACPRCGRAMTGRVMLPKVPGHIALSRDCCPTCAGWGHAHHIGRTPRTTKGVKRALRRLGQVLARGEAPAPPHVILVPPEPSEDAVMAAVRDAVPGLRQRLAAKRAAEERR